jgi:hypothetical protein
MLSGTGILRLSARGVAAIGRVASAPDDIASAEAWGAAKANRRSRTNCATSAQRFAEMAFDTSAVSCRWLASSDRAGRLHAGRWLGEGAGREPGRQLSDLLFRPKKRVNLDTDLHDLGGWNPEICGREIGVEVHGGKK